MDGRKRWRRKISESLRPNEARIWFHCSSLGEFEQGRPVMEKIKTIDSNLKIVLTFFSPSGFEVRKNYQGVDYVFYMPSDTKANAADFISLINPQKVFFTKYEYWHHYFHQLRKKEIPLYMVSAVFRPSDRFFKWYGKFFRNMLMCVTRFFVQDVQSQVLLKEVGFANSTVAGDTRFDRVLELAKQAKEIAIAKRFYDGNKVLVAGSTWSPDEKIIAGTLRTFAGKMKLIIAPHEINEERVEEVLQTFSDFIVIRFSEAGNTEVTGYDVLLIDNIGMLSSLYRYGTCAYIGGGFGKGIHNTLEAAVYGIPLFFGPNYEKFHEAKELLKCGGASSISDSGDLAEQIRIMIEEDVERGRRGQASLHYVQSNSGATDKILSTLLF